MKTAYDEVGESLILGHSSTEKITSVRQSQSRVSVSKLFSALSLLIILGGSPSFSEARKSFLVREQHDPLLAPKVSGYDFSWCPIPWPGLKITDYRICVDS